MPKKLKEWIMQYVSEEGMVRLLNMLANECSVLPDYCSEDQDAEAAYWQAVSAVIAEASAKIHHLNRG